MFEKANQTLSAMHDRTGITTLDYAALYRTLALEPVRDTMFNTGVFAFLNPGMTEFIGAFPGAFADQSTGPYFDQVPFTHYLLTHGRHLIMDERFNVLWVVYKVFSSMEKDDHCVRNPVESGYLAAMINVLNRSWFLHFAGRQGDMPILRGATCRNGIFTINDLALRSSRHELDRLVPGATPSSD